MEGYLEIAFSIMEDEIGEETIEFTPSELMELGSIEEIIKGIYKMVCSQFIRLIDFCHNIMMFQDAIYRERKMD